MISASDLGRFPIFSGLSEAFLKETARLCSRRTYRAGEICVLEGARAQYLFLLEKGRIVLDRKLPRDWQLHESGVVHTLKEREIFGWSAIVEPGVHTATARCAEDSEVIRIDGKELLIVLDHAGEAGYLFMKRLAAVIALRLVETSNFMMREMADFAAYRSM